jgi:hypothetical protein
MVQSPDEAHYRLLAHRILAGKVVPFLGAGVNLCGRPDSVPFTLGRFLPSGRELAEYLAEINGYPDNDTTNLLRVSQYVDVMLGPGPLYQELHEVFDADYPPTPVHRMLAQLPGMIRDSNKRYFPLIITTNYDDALERAFAEAGEEYDLVTYIAQDPNGGLFRHSSPDGQARIISVPNKYDELRFDQRPVIAKIHGAVGRDAEDNDSYVITENHYIDYLSHTEISQLIPITVATRMCKSHLLFLGYSLKDWNLRVILNRLRDAGLGWKSWAVQPHPDQIEEKSWSRRDVDLLDARLETYIAGLTAALIEASTEASAVAQPVP